MIWFQIPTHIQQMSKEMDKKRFTPNPGTLRYIAMPLDEVPNRKCSSFWLHHWKEKWVYWKEKSYNESSKLCSTLVIMSPGKRVPKTWGISKFVKYKLEIISLSSISINNLYPKLKWKFISRSGLQPEMMPAVSTCAKNNKQWCQN